MIIWPALGIGLGGILITQASCLYRVLANPPWGDKIEGMMGPTMFKRTTNKNERSFKAWRSPNA